MGAADYLALCEHFDVIILRDIPRMTVFQRTEARRFITLIDALYDNRVRWRDIVVYIVNLVSLRVSPLHFIVTMVIYLNTFYSYLFCLDSTYMFGKHAIRRHFQRYPADQRRWRIQKKTHGRSGFVSGKQFWRKQRQVVTSRCHRVSGFLPFLGFNTPWSCKKRKNWKCMTFLCPSGTKLLRPFSAIYHNFSGYF